MGSGAAVRSDWRRAVWLERLGCVPTRALGAMISHPMEWCRWRAAVRKVLRRCSAQAKAKAYHAPRAHATLPRSGFVHGGDCPRRSRTPSRTVACREVLVIPTLWRADAALFHIRLQYIDYRRPTDPDIPNSKYNGLDPNHATDADVAGRGIGRLSIARRGR